AALNPATPKRRLEAAAAIGGPGTVRVLIDQLIGIDDQLHNLGRYDEALSNARHRLLGAIAATRQEAFLPVLLDKGNTTEARRLGLFADMLADHGGEPGNEKPQFSTADRTALRPLVQRWIETLCSAKEPQRYVAAEVARAAGRLADPELAEPLRL